MPNYMELAKADIGTKEVAGDHDNPAILQYYADVGFPNTRHDETPWCAAFTGSRLKKGGLPYLKTLTAKEYANYGAHRDEPEYGCIAVLHRGDPRSWEGHVGFVVGWTDTTVDILSGNQRNAVNVQTFPRSQVMAYRMPIEATVKELKDAGSKEMPMAELAEKVSVVGIITGGLTALTKDLNNLSAFVAQNAVFGLVVMGVAGLCLAYWWKKNRLKRHMQGQPLSENGSA